MAHIPKDEFAAVGRAAQKETRAERRRLERAEAKAASRVAPSRLYSAPLRAMLRALPPVARMKALALIEGRTERQETFREWVDRVHADYEWPPHLVALALVLQDVADGLRTRVMCFMPPRHGKQIADSEPVLTTDGWKRHGDLAVGDSVFAPDGTPTRIIAIGQPSNEKVEVEFTDGSRVRVHPEHEWTVYDRAYGEWRTVETQWMTTQAMQSGGRSRFQLPDRAALQCPTRALPVDPYTLGAWLGDGTTGAALLCGAPADLDHIVARIPYTRSRRYVQASTGVAYQRFLGLMTDLRRSGVLNDKHIPDDYQLAHETQRRALLAGLVDTDGSVGEDGRVRFVTCSEHLANDVAQLARGLGYRVGLYRRREPARAIERAIRDRQICWEVAWTPLDGLGQGTLPRKVNPRHGTARRIGIRAIHAAADEPGRCISVNRADGLYLVGRALLPTHNSEAISRLFTAYFLYRHPGLSVALTTYGADLSYELSRDARNNYLASGGRLAGDANAVKSWSTAQGGKLWATGVGGPATGRGFHLGVVDDPYKDHTEAGSAIVRKSRLAWYRSVFRTRAAPGAAIVILLTRWHQADVVGELLKEEEVTKQRWHILEMAAEKYTGPRVTAGDDGKPGTASSIKPHKWPSTVTIEPDARDHPLWLWASRFTVDEYESIKRGLGGDGGYFWNALYQQRPTAMEGGLFKEKWFKRIARGQLPPMIGRMRRWDLAATEKDGAFTAGLRVEKDAQHNYYITSLVHDQWEAGARDTIIVATARVDGMGVVQGFPIDPAAAGKQVAAQFPRMLDGIAPVLLMPESGSKLLRLTMPASAASNGLLFIVDEPWAAVVITELCAAGEGAEYWDIADALSGAFGYLGPIDAADEPPRSHSLRTNR